MKPKPKSKVCGTNSKRIKAAQTTAAAVAVVLAVALCPSVAESRIVSSWNPERIAEKAEILVVGEVREVTELTRVSKDKNRWKIPLLRMNAKIRNAQKRKIPYMLVVGEQEEEAGAVSVRTRTGDRMNGQPLDEFMAFLLEKIEAKEVI